MLSINVALKTYGIVMLTTSPAFETYQNQHVLLLQNQYSKWRVIKEYVFLFTIYLIYLNVLVNILKC